jgi:hypothetical protein
VWLFRDASWRQHFRLCIPGFDHAHVVASDFFGMDIWRQVKLISINLVVLAKKRRIRNICWFTVSHGLTFGASIFLLS